MRTDCPRDARGSSGRLWVASRGHLWPAAEQHCTGSVLGAPGARSVFGKPEAAPAQRGQVGALCARGRFARSRLQGH